MTMHSWLDKLVNRTRNHPITRRSTKTQSRTRLTIEGLEDRWVPATYTVLNSNDTGAGSLRDAVAQANANIGADTIVFGDGSGTGGTNFLDATSDTITLTSGDITFAGDTSLTTVTGPGANLLTISGGNTQRVFWVNAGISTSISGMTLTSGRANGTPGTNASAGAAVYNAGTLDLTNVTVSGNSSTGTGGSGKGGAVHSQGNLTLTNCTVTGNTGNGVNTGNGSGILAISNSTISNNTLSGLQVGGGQARLIGTTISGNTRQGVNAYLTDLMMANCTVSGNSNSGDGAGVLIGLGSAALTNCTITGNTATGNGGGILLRGTVTLTNCTITGNTAAIGGGVNVFSGTPTFVNTIVAGNTASNRGPDVGGTSNNPQAISSLGNNLIGKTDGSTGWSGSDLTGTIAAPINAQLGTLASNGGTMQTLALLSGSKAINAGNPSLAPSEVQDIAIIAPGGSGTFSVTFSAQTTSSIAYNAAAGTVQSALNALSSIGGVGGSVTVTKSGNVFRVTFGGTLANQNQAQMIASGSGGATATVLTLVDGNTDQRGQNRSANTDIGAFETQFKVYATADSGNGSLRQAILNANTSIGADSIIFSSLFNTAQTITLTSGVLNLTDAATTTITGTSAGVTVSGNNASGVFKVNNGASAALSRLTITGGNSYQGGGLWNDFGNVTITDSAVINNTASFAGGLDNVGGTMVLTNVTLSGNTASNNGGAIDNVGATLTLVNTTISGNTAAEGGGLRNNGTANISNTIIAGNTAPSAPDVWNTVHSQGNNLVGKTDGSSGWLASDLKGTIVSPLNPQLGALASNGGPTQTMALLSGSPAINAGNAANAPVTDQRGLTRGGNTDIGAYETQFKVYTTADGGNGSLRQAIANANSSAGSDSVVFSSLFNTAQTITLTSGQITFTDTATTVISGSPGGLTVSGNNASRVFVINLGASAVINAVTITGGLSGPSGGGIVNSGNLTLTSATVSGNTSGDDSGAIANFGGATLNITNSTFANNSTANDGGAIRNGGTLTVTNSTFSGNHSGIAGGGIRNDGTMTIANSIIAGNSANQVGPDIFGVVASNGNNLIGKTDDSFGWGGTDLTGTIASPLNAQLGSLTNNGGPTQTMALLSNSPAINAGDVTRAPVTDQRGQARFGNTDIGAFEYIFKVTNTANSGTGSLRGAINNSNAVNTLDTIIFKIPGAGVHTITPSSALPTISDPVIIDGTSASGYSGSPLIELAGTSAGAGVNGLTISSNGSTISGLAINRFTGSGIVLSGASATGNVIKGNYLGIGTNGGTDLGNTLDGITITGGAANNTIGGIGANDRNVISGNTSDGIEISGSGSDSNVLMNNYIGLNAAGTSPVRNDGNGVFINTGPQFNQIGTNGDGLNDTSERNVISGNSSVGGGANINIVSANNNRVSGNFIGTNATGTATVLNGGRGIRVATGSSFNIIGTDGSNDAYNANERNIISGSNDAGIFLAGNANDNTIEGNWVGLNAAGTASLGNGGDGISISGSKRNRVGSNADGISDAIEANVIVGSGNFAGVLIADPGNQDNIIAGNFIGTNPTGTVLLGTQQSGVAIGNDAHDNRIGGLNPAERNIISGSSKHGIYVLKYQSFPTGYNTTIQGNYIGTDVSGTVDFGNGLDGVMLENSYGNIVGGTAAGAGNLISGNNASGVEITGTASTGNTVLGNRIGTNSTGTGTIGNSVGITVTNAPGNLIGGGLAGAGNLISGNAGFGIVVSGASATDVSITNNQIRGNQSSGIWTNTTKGTIQGNTVAYNGGAGVSLVSGNSLIRQNSFIGNTGLGIDVGAAGLTPNDSGDLDSVLNAPVLTVAHLTGGLLEISGFTRPGSTIEFYIAGPDTTQFGEGTTYLATLKEGAGTDTDTSSGTYNSPLRGLNVGTDSTSRFSFLIPVPDSVTQDSVITALTIDPIGGPNSGTSEFSANITPTPGVVFGAPLVYGGAGATILEGGTFAGSGTFTDLDSTKWSATVDYGDGSGVQTLVLNPISYQPNGDGYTPSATGTFDLAHVYSKAGTYSVNVKVTDDAGNAGNGFSLVVVNSAPAQIDDNNINVSPSVINEGGSVTVTGKFTDPSSVDHHSVMITWGDGTVSPADSIDEVNRTFTATHLYSDDKPKGTESDVYSLQVAITDNSSAVARTTFGLFYVQVNNVRPSNLTLAPLTSTINENGFVTLGGIFSDSGILDQHLVTINWGDGSPVDVIPLAAGILNFSGITHQYLNNPALPATSYGIQVSVTDDDEPLRPATATTSIIVNDASASNLQIVASPTTSSEGSSTSLSGTFFDPGTKDRHKVVVNWGDGLPVSELVLPAGVTAFSGLSHTYLDNPAGQPTGAYTIQVTVTDVNEPSGAPLIGYKAQTVLNVAPTLGQLDLTRSDGTPLDSTTLTGARGQINENDEVLLTGSFADLGRLDNQVVTINWGDGSPLTTATVSKASNTFQAIHRFVDNAVGTLVSLDSIRVTITDNDGGSSSSSVGLAIANVAPKVRILSGGGSTAGVTLKADASDTGPIDASGLTYLWTVNGSSLTGTGSSFNLPTPTAFQSYQVTLTVTDNDGVSTYTTTTVIVLDDNPNTFEIPVQPAGVSSVTVFGLGGNDIISAGKLLVDGFNRIIFDADGIPLSTNELAIPVILDGGSGQDTLIGGSADDTIYLQQGNDTGYGQQGNDQYRLKPNSTLTVVDGSGFNTLDFGLADFGSNVGVTFNLQQTSGQVQDVAPNGTLAGHHFVSANDLGTGVFTTLIGSSFDDNLTAASGATLFGGAGADTFKAVSSTASTLSNAIFNGGADGDFLITSGPSIGNLTFNGDDGGDILQNLGVITGGLIFNGGADADVINNSPTGVILGSPTFNGDDGVFSVTNQGNIQGTPTFNGGADGDVILTNFGTITGSPTFNGGADAEVLVNQPGGVISGTPTFNGDDGVIFVTNYGTINGTPTFIGGADADSFTNGPGGVISGALVFNGDDGANTFTNFGVILGTPTFIGGADADVFTNSQGGVISGTPIFTGGADADSFINAPGAVISGNLVFNGDTGADLITNYGSITGTPTFVGGADGDVFTNAPGAVISGAMTFNGDDGANTIVNFGAITGSATFVGGADADVFTNASGAVISGTPIFTGGADADTFVNSVNATISGNLTFNGDDGADTVVNSGTIGNALGLGTLTFHGGADGDAILNPGTILGNLSFNGDDGADMFYNGATTVGGTPVSGSIKTLTFNGDSGADLLINPTGGSIGTLTFGGGADGDVLTNQGVILGNATFNGDDGANFLTNNGTIGGTATFVGGADADTFVNTGPIGTLSFNGDLGADRLYNSQNAISLVSFNAGAGNDLFINDGSGINIVSFVGGTGNDVFGNTGANLGTVTFRGDDGADTFVNTGNTTGGFTTSLTFGGGADQDTLINKGSAIGTGFLGVSFGGDDGADTLVNQGSNIGSLIFSGGADSDGFLNSGVNVGLIRFTGDDGADVLRNDGLNLGILTFSGGADGDVLANYGTVIGALTFGGDDGADSLRNSGVISGTILFNGDDSSDLLVNHANGVISGPATFNGGADGDTFVNSEGGSISGSLTFNGDDGADLVGNAGVIPGSVTFNGGADADSIVNVGAIGGSLTFGGDDGADAFYNGGYVNGVFIGGFINTLTFNGDDGADVLANPAGGTIVTLTFGGGADGDVLNNLGVITGAMSFQGDSGADVLVNQVGGVINGPLTFNGGADADSLYNQPGAVIGGQSGGLTFNGDEGADSLVNAGAIVGVLTFAGGADADTLTNTIGGIISGPLSVNGDDGADQVNNQMGAIIGNLTFNGGADGDFLANQGTISGNLNFNGEDGANTFTQGGLVSGNLSFTGGADADTLTTTPGSTIGGSLTFTGDDGADTLIVSGVIAGSLVFSGGSDADVLILGPTGSAGSVEAHAGDDKDHFIIAGGGGSFLLDGGAGDDTYTFAGIPTGNITIGESYTGNADSSSDTLDFSAYTGGSLVLDLALTTPQVLINNRLTLTFADSNGMENVIGTPQADTVYGNDRPNLLTGAALADDRMIAPSATPPQGLQTISRTQWVLLDFDTQSETGEHVYTEAERAAIQARIESVYQGPDPLNPWFDVKFTRDLNTIPSEIFRAGQFATLFFNRTPSFNRPGGEASEVDFGNTNLDGFASVQVNGLVGGEGQPADTSDHFVRLSAKIAAHELAHLLGVRHSDSFGPIGLGLHSPPGTEKFGPDYPGPAAAYETFDHIISSPATVGSDRFNDLRDLYFGPREAIKLTFDQKGVTLSEPAAIHSTIATAAPINLYALTVPNTATSGLDAGKSFQVGAVNVSGNLKIDPSTGRAESDYFALSGNKGDILTMEVGSTLLARLNGQDTIDSVLSVYDANGNLVPYYGSLARNDDQFEPTDSLILDLILPATGTYYVQVASFSRNPADPIFDPTNPTSPLNPSNLGSSLNPLNPSFSQDRLNAFLATRDGTDTGAYGLFIYRFSAANPTDQGDYLNGRAGNDTLKGGLGNDTLIGGAGQDVIDSGEGGSGYVLGVTPRETSFDLSLVSPALQTTLAINDPSGSAFWDVTVDYGDGNVVNYPRVQAVSPVTIGHTYSTPGNYTALITVQNDDGLVGTSSLTVKVSAQKASSFVVAPVGTGTYGATATLIASLGSEGTALAGKAVSFTFNNGVVVTALGTATTDANGIATLTGVDLTRIGAGTYVGYVGANFAGDALYQATSSSGNLIIGKASLTVTADAKSKVYGAADPALTYTPTGTLFYGDSYSVISGVSLTTKTGALATAGTQPIIISGGTAANYNITTVNGILSVSQKALTITASSRSKNFGATVIFAGTEFAANGLVYSDAVTSVSLSSTGAPASAPVGNYPITPSAATGAGLGNYSISYSAGVLTVSIRAGSVFVLSPTAKGALNLSGNASLNTIGDLVVDSSSTSAITASGNASVIASALLNMGGISISGNAKVSTPQGRPGSSADPYANLAVPTSTGSVLSVSVSGNSVQTINPGTYSSIKVSGNGKLTLNPGTYIIAGGGLSVSGNGSISGNGVTIYNGGSNIISTGPASFGGIGLSGNGLVQLSAPQSGIYAGILIFQSRDNALALALSGNSALGISGMIYAPKALLSLSGNAQLQSHIPIVVDQLQISGNGSSSLSTEGTGTSAGQLLSGDRALFIDDPSGYLSGNARARINDAINHLEQLLQPYSVTVSLTTDRATADLVLNTATTSPVGGLAQGVLGCYSETGEITLIQGWNWYTGSDPAGIGANQFDFSTIVVHELGHALGLGHSSNSTSTMFAGLSTGQTRRLLTTADLSIPETEDDDRGHEGLHAIQPTVTTMAPVGNQNPANSVSETSPSYSGGTLVSILDRLFTGGNLPGSQAGLNGSTLNLVATPTPKFGNGLANRSFRNPGTAGLMNAAPLVRRSSHQAKAHEALADSIAMDLVQADPLGNGSISLAHGSSQTDDVMIHEMMEPNHV